MRRDQVEHQRRIRAALNAANDGRKIQPGEPAFHVVLATNHWGDGCTLRWDSHTPQRQVLARFACFPAAPRHDGGSLSPQTVELSLTTARNLLEACSGGAVSDEAVAELRRAVQAA